MIDATKGEVYSVTISLHEACANDDQVIGQLVRKKIKQLKDRGNNGRELFRDLVSVANDKDKFVNRLCQK